MSSNMGHRSPSGRTMDAYLFQWKKMRASQNSGNDPWKHGDSSSGTLSSPNLRGKIEGSRWAINPSAPFISFHLPNWNHGVSLSDLEFSKRLLIFVLQQKVRVEMISHPDPPSKFGGSHPTKDLGHRSPSAQTYVCEEDVCTVRYFLTGTSPTSDFISMPSLRLVAFSVATTFFVWCFEATSLTPTAIGAATQFPLYNDQTNNRSSNPRHANERL